MYKVYLCSSVCLYQLGYCAVISIKVHTYIQEYIIKREGECPTPYSTV